MKNLKKLLSLVLVAVMVMSLFVTASAANLTKYTDLGNVDKAFIEAVDVMVSLGIIEGRSATELAPKGNITRAEITKIATYLKTGKAAADRLVAQTTAFSDVPASHWASKYIAYLTETGVIAGRGNGIFDPEANVTGVEVGKIFLGTLGYGVKNEFVGANWALNVVSRASAIGIFTLSTDIDLNAPATREQVFQYAFNTIQTNTMGGKNYIVEYTEFLQNYIPSGSNAWNQTLDLEDNMFIGGRYFGLTAKYDVDDYGLLTRTWLQNGFKITAEYIAEIVLGEFVLDGKLTKHDLATKYSWDRQVDVIVNGDWAISKDETDTAIGDLSFFENFARRGNNALAFGTELVGAKVYLTDNGGNWVPADADFDKAPNFSVGKIVIIYEYLAKVTRVDSRVGTVNLEVYNPVGGAMTTPTPATAPSFATSSVQVISNIVAEGFAVGDYVAVTLPRDYSNTVPGDWSTLAYDATAVDPLNIVKAETVKGTMRSYTRATTDTANIYLDTITLADGDKVVFAGHYGLGKFKVPTFNNDAIFFIGTNGVAIGWSGDNSVWASMSYGYVTAFHVTYNPFTGGYAVKAQVTLGDTAAEAFFDLPVAKTPAGAYELTINGTKIVIYNGTTVNTTTDAQAAIVAATGVKTTVEGTSPVGTAGGWYSYSLNPTTNVHSLGANTTGSAAPIVASEIYDLLPSTTIDPAVGQFLSFAPASGAGQANIFTANSLGYFVGKKSTGYLNYPKGTFPNILTIRDDATGEVYVVYALGTSAPPAVTMFAMITGTPYYASTTVNETNYGAVAYGFADNGPVDVVETSIPNTRWDEGTVVAIRIDDNGRPIIVGTTEFADPPVPATSAGKVAAPFTVDIVLGTYILLDNTGVRYTITPETTFFDSATGLIDTTYPEAGDILTLWVDGFNNIIFAVK